MGATCSRAQVPRAEAARPAPVHRLLAADGGLLDRAESGALLRPGTARSDRGAADPASRGAAHRLRLAGAIAPLVLVALDALVLLVTALSLFALPSATLRLIAAGQLGLLLVEAEGARALVGVYAIGQRGRPLRLRAPADAPHPMDYDAEGGWRALALGAPLGLAAPSWWDALALAWYAQPRLLPAGWRGARELGAFAANYRRVRGLVAASARALPNALLVGALLCAPALDERHGGPGPLSRLLATLAAADEAAGAAGRWPLLRASLVLSLASLFAHAPQLARALREPRRWALGGEAPLLELSIGALGEARLAFSPAGAELEALCRAVVVGARRPAPAILLGRAPPVDSRRLDSVARAAVFAALLDSGALAPALRARDCGLKAGGVRRLAPALGRCAQLNWLDFSANGLDDADGAALVDGAATACGARGLALASNALGAKAAVSLRGWLVKHECKLSRLALDSNLLADDALVHLAKGLGLNRSLTRLSLASNRLAHGGALALAAALGVRGAGAGASPRVGGVNKTLRHLDLSANPLLGDAGAAALADALRVNGALRSLLLADAGIGAAGAKALGEALPANGTLTLLRLDRNGLIGAAGAAQLFGGLRGQSSLAHLSLCACGVSAAGASALASALTSALAGALRANAALERLELAGNDLGDPAALALGAALSHNATLVTLDLSFNLMLAPAAKAALRGKWEASGRAPTDLTMY